MWIIILNAVLGLIALVLDGLVEMSSNKRQLKIRILTYTIFAFGMSFMALGLFYYQKGKNNDAIWSLIIGSFLTLISIVICIIKIIRNRRDKALFEEDKQSEIQDK